MNVFSFDEKNRYNNRIKCFATTNDSSKLWFGTWGGLVRLNLKDNSYVIEKKSETSVNSLSSDKISCIFKDKQNNLWIGTEENGVNIYFNSLNKFPLYNFNNGLTNDFVYSIYQLNNKNILIGTENGLFNLNSQSQVISDYSQVLRKHRMYTVLSLFEDSKGNIWIGSYGQGIVVYNPQTKKEVRLLADENLGGTVMKIIEDHAGVIWVATYKDGLYCINPNTYAIKRFTTENGLPSNNIYCVYENKADNTLMLGTDGGCVF